MNRFNPSGRATLLAVLACVSITLLLFTFRVVTVRRWCSTLNWIKTIGDSSRRHYNTSDEMRNGTGDQFSPDHQQTVDYIRRHISHPSLTRPRQLVKSDRKDALQHGQSAFVDKLLSRRRDGFFVECGAGDGEVNSNSLFFELQRNWTGLLIEVSADDHRALLNKNRRASVLRACLSPERRPGKYQLRRGPFTGVVDTKHQVHLPFIGNMRPRRRSGLLPAELRHGSSRRLSHRLLLAGRRRTGTTRPRHGRLDTSTYRRTNCRVSRRR